jgi:hypothetical protein
MTGDNPTLQIGAYRLPPHQVELLNRVSVERNLFNKSAALRQIITEWEQQQRRVEMFVGSGNSTNPEGEQR